MQQGLTAGEKSDKPDDSPVTVADYGARALRPFFVHSCMVDVLHSLAPYTPLADALHVAHGVTIAGAQALVAWALQRAEPGSRLSMVAEEDAADLK